MERKFKVGDVIMKTITETDKYVIGRITEFSLDCPFCNIEVIKWNNYLSYEFKRGSIYTGLNLDKCVEWRIKKLSEDEAMAWLI